MIVILYIMNMDIKIYFGSRINKILLKFYFVLAFFYFNFFLFFYYIKKIFFKMNKSYIELVEYLNDQINKSLITDEKIIKIINDINDFNSKTKNQQYYIRNKERFKKYYEENKEKIKKK